MPVFKPTYKDPKNGERKISAVWWYDFIFAGRRVRESAKTTSKTLAKLAEQKRRRRLEEGFNGISDRRDEHIRTVSELADAYMADYKLRHASITFAEYAVDNVKRHVGDRMAVDITDETVKEYQSARLKETATERLVFCSGFLLTKVMRFEVGCGGSGC